MTPQQFLRELGIGKRPELDLDSPKVRAELKTNGIDLNRMKDGEGFSANANDAMFADERVARSIMAENFDRIRQNLQDFMALQGFPASPRSIADLGGGPGVFGMYWARQHADAQVTVFDWSAAALRMGEQWARRLGIRNITFQQQSYDEAASGPQYANDLVLFFYGILWEDARCPDGPFEPGEGLLAAMTALSRLLADHGVGVICGPWNHLNSGPLFEAIRRTHLCVDWRGSLIRGRVDKKQNDFVPEMGYVFVRRNLPLITHDSREDVVALFASGEMDPSNLVFGRGATMSVSGLFAGGRELLGLELRGPNDSSFRLQIRYKSGLLLLSEFQGGSGPARCNLKSLASIGAFLDLAERSAQGWPKIPELRVTKNHVDPAISHMLAVYPVLTWWTQKGG